MSTCPCKSFLVNRVNMSHDFVYLRSVSSFQSAALMLPLDGVISVSLVRLKQRNMGVTPQPSKSLTSPKTQESSTVW